MASVDTRLTQVETICNVTLPRVERFMQEGQDLRERNAVNIATILQKMESFEAYQVNCDSERKAQETLIRAQGNDIQSLKSYKRNQIKLICGFSGLIGFVANVAPEVVRKWIGW